MSVKTVKKNLQMMLLAFPLLAVADPVPDKADVAKIYNIEQKEGVPIDVRYFRKAECPKDKWCPINQAGKDLYPNDFLLTGNISRADLALLLSEGKYRDIVFWQAEGSRLAVCAEGGYLQLQSGARKIHLRTCRFKR